MAAERGGCCALVGLPVRAQQRELRWKAPVDPKPWTAPRPTQQFGNACVQYGRIYGPGANNRYDATIGTTLNQAVGSGDCLHLNIWRPASPQGGLPGSYLSTAAATSPAIPPIP